MRHGAQPFLPKRHSNHSTPPQRLRLPVAHLPLAVHARHVEPVRRSLQLLVVPGFRVDPVRDVVVHEHRRRPRRVVGEDDFHAILGALDDDVLSLGTRGNDDAQDALVVLLAPHVPGPLLRLGGITFVFRLGGGVLLGRLDRILGCAVSGERLGALGEPVHVRHQLGLRHVRGRVRRRRHIADVLAGLAHQRGQFLPRAVGIAKGVLELRSPRRVHLRVVLVLVVVVDVVVGRDVARQGVELGVRCVQGVAHRRFVGRLRRPDRLVRRSRRIHPDVDDVAAPAAEGDRRWALEARDLWPAAGPGLVVVGAEVEFVPLVVVDHVETRGNRGRRPGVAGHGGN